MLWFALFTLNCDFHGVICIFGLLMGSEVIVWYFGLVNFCWSLVPARAVSNTALIKKTKTFWINGVPISINIIIIRQLGFYNTTSGWSWKLIIFYRLHGRLYSWGTLGFPNQLSHLYSNMWPLFTAPRGTITTVQIAGTAALCIQWNGDSLYQGSASLKISHIHSHVSEQGNSNLLEI